jgi:MoaA/NifB/PqqE/SkfB family radical SAM enzyme
MLSHACPLKCNFCCSTREVVGRARISRTMIEQCILTFADQPAVTRFAFTGGEPFLYLEDIKAALASVRDLGVSKPAHIVTSAYWAKDLLQVRSILSDLQAVGIDGLGLSFDHEHAKWVAPDQIRLVCRAAGELGLWIYLTGTFWSETDAVEDLFPDLVAASHIRMSSSIVVAMGRARTSASWPRAYNLPMEEKLSCGRPGYYSLTIYPDGEVYPCCSGGMQIEGKLSCGNVHRDSPQRIVYLALANFHVRLVKEFGWAVLYELVAREAPDILPRLPSIHKADSVCEICRDLNLGFKDVLAPIYEQIEAEYARCRAALEWDQAIRAPNRDQTSCEIAPVRKEEFLELLASNRQMRLDYLAGMLEVSDVIGEAHAAFGS